MENHNWELFIFCSSWTVELFSLALVLLLLNLVSFTIWQCICSPCESYASYEWHNLARQGGDVRSQVGCSGRQHPAVVYLLPVNTMCAFSFGAILIFLRLISPVTNFFAGMHAYVTCGVTREHIRPFSCGFLIFWFLWKPFLICFYYFCLFIPAILPSRKSIWFWRIVLWTGYFAVIKAFVNVCQIQFTDGMFSKSEHSNNSKNHGLDFLLHRIHQKYTQFKFCAQGSHFVCLFVPLFFEGRSPPPLPMVCGVQPNLQPEAAFGCGKTALLDRCVAKICSSGFTCWPIAQGRGRTSLLGMVVLKGRDSFFPSWGPPLKDLPWPEGQPSGPGCWTESEF